MQPRGSGFFNVSYFEKEVNEEILRMVGKPYPFFTSLRMGGTGSPRMIIEESSETFKPWTQADKYMQYCNIEIRPRGIIVRFRSRLEALAFVISYPELKLETVDQGYLVSNGVDYMKLIPFKNKKQVRTFFGQIERYL